MLPVPHGMPHAFEMFRNFVSPTSVRSACSAIPSPKAFSRAFQYLPFVRALEFPALNSPALHLRPVACGGA